MRFVIPCLGPHISGAFGQVTHGDRVPLWAGLCLCARSLDRMVTEHTCSCPHGAGAGQRAKNKQMIKPTNACFKTVRRAMKEKDRLQRTLRRQSRLGSGKASLQDGPQPWKGSFPQPSLQSRLPSTPAAGTPGTEAPLATAHLAEGFGHGKQKTWKARTENNPS